MMMTAFFIMAVLIVLSAIGVVAFSNPLYSALALVLNLLTVAGIFALLDAHFLSAVQIIVYAGAIMVLVIFVLMLLNLKTEALKRRSPSFIGICVLSGVAFLQVVCPLLDDAFKVFPDSDGAVQGTIKEVGKLLYTSYLFPFEAASFLIMAALAGAVMLSKRNVKRSN